MLPDSWWWPWWVSSLIDIAVIFGALVVLRLSKRRAVRTLAAVLAVAGLVAAILAPIVMTDEPDRPMHLRAKW
jgi:hypothetical protein